MGADILVVAGAFGRAIVVAITATVARFTVASSVARVASVTGARSYAIARIATVTGARSYAVARIAAVTEARVIVVARVTAVAGALARTL